MSENVELKDGRIWADRKRILGMPITFTKYSMSEDRLFIEKGLVKTQYDELLLYRVRDLSLTRTLSQKIFGVGTITIYAADKSSPTLKLVNIKNSYEIKELLHEKVEAMKEQKKMGVSEFVDGDTF